MSKALSEREIVVIEELIRMGANDRDIADIIGRSAQTVTLIRKGKRDEENAKKRERWYRHSFQQAIQDEEVEHPESHSYSSQLHIPEESDPFCGKGDEIDQLNLTLKACTDAIRKLIDILS